MKQRSTDPVVLDDGVYRLWVSVTANAVERLMHGWDHDGGAYDFIFRDNDFFMTICESWGVSLEAARARIRKMVEVQYANHR